MSSPSRVTAFLLLLSVTIFHCSCAQYTDPATSDQLPDNVVFANPVCMGAKNDAFGFFPITTTVQLSRISFHATSGGVSCAGNLLSSCPFCCGSLYSVGLVVVQAQDVATYAMDATGSFVVMDRLPALAKKFGQMVGWNQQVPTNFSTLILRIAVGAEISAGSYAALVYIPDYFDYPDEGLNSDTSTCGYVAGLRFVHLSTAASGSSVSPRGKGHVFAAQAQLSVLNAEAPQGSRALRLPDYGGWITMRLSNTSAVKSWWAANPSSYDMRADNATITSLLLAQQRALASGSPMLTASVVYAASEYPSYLVPQGGGGGGGGGVESISSPVVATLVPISNASAANMTSAAAEKICADTFRTQRGSISTVPSLLPSPVVAAGSVLSWVFNGSDTSWISPFLLSVSPQLLSVFYRSSLQSSSLIVLQNNNNASSGSSGSAVLCATRNLASDPRDVLIQQPLLTNASCNLLTSDHQRCTANPFCRAVDPGASQEPCCWNGQSDTAFFDASQVRLFPQCACGLSGTGLTPRMLFLIQPNCTVQRAAAKTKSTIPLIVSLVCSSSAYASQGVSYAACVTQFTKCAAGPYDVVELVNRAFAQTGSGIIPGMECPVALIPPPTSGAPPSTAPATSSPRSVMNVSTAVVTPRALTFSIDDVMAGKAKLTLSANMPWNLSAVLEGLPNAITDQSPTFRKFEFAFWNVFTNFSQATRLLDSYVIEIPIGPCTLYDPTSTDSWQIVVSPSWFVGAAFQPIVSASSVSVTITVSDSVARAKKRITFIISASIAIGALATGSSGLIGLTALQTQILSVTSHCAEPWTASYFESTRQYFILLPSLILDDNVFTFGFTAGLLGALLALHSLVALIHFHFFAPTGSWRHSANVMYFPSPYLFGSMMFWVCLTLSCFSGIIDGSIPYQRMLLGLGWLISVLLLTSIWYDGLRSGYDGYFKLYDPDDQRLLSSRFRWFRRFGRFERIFLPSGAWVQLRGYGAIRSNCNGQGCKFVLYNLALLAAQSANSAHFAYDGESFCDSYFYIFAAIGLVNVALLASIQPFRIPLLNMIWLVARVTEVTQNLLQAYWHSNATTPSNPTALSIQLCATVLLSANAAFVGYSVLVTFFEYSLRTDEFIGNVVLIENKIASGIQAVVNVAMFNKNDGGQGDEQEQQDPEVLEMMQELDDLYGPVETHRAPRFGTGFKRNALNSGTLDDVTNGTEEGGRQSGCKHLSSLMLQEQEDGGGRHLAGGAAGAKNRQLQEEKEAEEQRARKLRVVLVLQPIPPSVTNGELKLLISVWSTVVTDIKRVGSSAFVGMLNARAAHSACAAFNGRLLFGTRVECHVIEDAFQLALEEDER